MVTIPTPRWELIFGAEHMHNLSYIQIGANCGTSNCSGAGGRDDPVWDYQRQYRWRGAVVEANPRTFIALSRNYRPHPAVRPLNLAITGSAGTVDFWCPRFGHMSEARLSEGCTTQRSWGEASAFGLRNASGGGSRHMRVKAETLHGLWSRLRPDRVDLLVVDVRL